MCSLLSEAHSLDEIPQLEPVHFHEGRRRIVFQAIRELHHSGKAANSVTVNKELARAGLLERIGGVDGLQALLDAVPHGNTLKDSAMLIVEQYHRQQLKRIAEDASMSADDQTQEINKVIGQLAKELDALQNGTRLGSMPEPMDLHQIVIDGIPPIPWILDGWLAEKTVNILAGRTGDGKTTLAVGMARALALGEPFLHMRPARLYRVLYIDEEQTEFTLARQMLLFGDPPPKDKLAVYQGQYFSFTTPEGLASLEAVIRKHRPEIIFTDSFTTMSLGYDDNKTCDVAIVMGTILRLRTQYQTAIVVIDHEAKSQQDGTKRPIGDRIRGNLAKVNHADLTWMIGEAKGATRACKELQQGKNRLDGELRGRLVGYDFDIDEKGRRASHDLVDLGPLGDESTAPRAKIIRLLREWIDAEDLVEFTTAQAKKMLTGMDALPENTLRHFNEALNQLIKSEEIERSKRGHYRVLSGNSSGQTTKADIEQGELEASRV